MPQKKGPDNVDPYCSLYTASLNSNEYHDRFRPYFEVRGRSIRLYVNATVGRGVIDLKYCSCCGCWFRPGWRPSLLRLGYAGKWR